MAATTVRGIMRPVIWVDSIDSLGEAFDIMRVHGIRHLPVVHGGALVGILAERDLLEYRAALGFDERWREYGVSGAMTRSPRTARPDERIADAAARLVAEEVGALPVVDGNVLVGIVTAADVLGAGAPVTHRATAAEAMTPGPFVAKPDESLLEAATRMRVHGVRHLPVVDERNHVIGMLSDRDVRAARRDPPPRVRDVMTPSPLTVTEDWSMVELAKIFEGGQFGAVPVVDDAEQLVGIVSYVDALRELGRT